MIRTLVVDDDFRVAAIHTGYVDKVDGFVTVGRAHTAAEAWRAVTTEPPDLVLLDLYLPDEHGLTLMRRVLDRGPTHPDFIVITAARDTASVRTAMRLGAVHYLVKPFSFARLSERLTAYRALRERLEHIGEANQDDIDSLYGLLRAPGPDRARLPKGCSPLTMARIVDALRSAGADLSAADVADVVGISRPTAHRYLAHLVETGAVDLHLQYGAAGRPENRYRATGRLAPP